MLRHRPAGRSPPLAQALGRQAVARGKMPATHVVPGKLMPPRMGRTRRRGREVQRSQKWLHGPQCSTCAMSAGARAARVGPVVSSPSCAARVRRYLRYSRHLPRPREAQASCRPHGPARRPAVREPRAKRAWHASPLPVRADPVISRRVDRAGEDVSARSAKPRSDRCHFIPPCTCPR